jgi:hypothetical protein
MRLPIPLLAALLAAPLAIGSLHAQTSPTPPPAAADTPATDTPAPAAPAPAPAPPAVAAPGTHTHPPRKTATRKRLTPAQRFDAANTTHDGHLTRDQAKAGHLYAVYRHFDAIDTAKKGYVTKQDIRSYVITQRRARRAAKQAAATKG